MSIFNDKMYFLSVNREHWPGFEDTGYDTRPYISGKAICLSSKILKIYTYSLNHKFCFKGSITNAFQIKCPTVKS